MFDAVFEALSDLPVNTIAQDVATDFLDNQQVVIVTSEVASGKTMLIPAMIAQRIINEMALTAHIDAFAEMDDEIATAGLSEEDAIDSIVYVLEPRRDLTNNVADSLVELIGEEYQDWIGVLNSARSGEESYICSDTKIVFTTVGYALASGIINTGKYFVLDEAHETSIDLSLAKAILQKRHAAGDAHVALLSATIDVSLEKEFWQNAVHYTTEGSAYPVEFIHQKEGYIEDAVAELVSGYNRTGILVFVEGKHQIEDAATEIARKLTAMGLHNNVDFVIHSIHGGSPGQDRQKAFAYPKTQIKILIGTNVLESGINLPWVNAGVSNGKTNIMTVRGNIHHLVTEDLPQWRIEQQIGRCGRFEPGTFILVAEKAKDERPIRQQPDIKRLPLTEMVMHCAKIDGCHPMRLNFNREEQPDHNAVLEAINLLEEYNFIEDHVDVFHLTAEGKLIADLPTGFAAAAAYSEAVNMGRLAEMIPLIASIEIGDIRQDHRYDLGLKSWETSDVISRVYAVSQLMWYRYNRGEDIEELAEANNISVRKLREYFRIVRSIEQYAGIEGNFRWYCFETDEEQALIDSLCKRVIFRATFQSSSRYQPIAQFVTLRDPAAWGGMATASLSKTSACRKGFCDGVIATGRPRRITPKNGRPFMVFEDVTIFTKEDVERLTPFFSIERLDPDKELRYLGGIFGVSQRPTYRDSIIAKPVEREEPKPTIGSFGELLKAKFMIKE